MRNVLTGMTFEKHISLCRSNLNETSVILVYIIHLLVNNPLKSATIKKKI